MRSIEPSLGPLADPFGLRASLKSRRLAETVVEAAWQAGVLLGLTVQHGLQYVIRPGTGIANPRDPAGRRIRNSAVLGVGATVQY